MILHTDLPTLDDKLNLNAQLTRIQERVMECRTPHVLGIHGDWGSGKTSFMRQLQQSLGGDIADDGSVEPSNRSMPKARKKELQKKVITVWFDAWQFQHDATPVVALLQEMRRQISASAAVVESLKKLGTIATLSALDSLSNIGKSISIDFMPDAEKIEKRGQQWEKENFREVITSRSIREHLCKTIESLLPSADARVIIFIDDLDRCSANSAMRLLEGLKVYLTVPNCVFILGMNERILVDAIGETFSNFGTTKDDELKLRAGHYLEKICTDIFRLPLPRSPIQLFGHWLEETSHRQSLQLAVGNCNCLPPNPRRLKALANQWNRFALKVAYPPINTDQKIWAVRVLVATYLHQFHRDLWERWHYNPDFWQEVISFCNGDYGDTPPSWAKPLRLTFDPPNSVTPATAKYAYPNPGDIDNFWIGALIVEYSDYLKPIDFNKLIF